MSAPVTRSSGKPTVSGVANPEKLGRKGAKHAETTSKVAACGACLLGSRTLRCTAMAAVVACVGIAALCYSTTGTVDAATLTTLSQSAVEALCPAG